MTKCVKLTEKDFFLLLKEKNEQAFSYLYDTYAPLIYGVILREVKNSKLASEILQHTFIKIIKECNNIDCINPTLFTWLLLLAKKTANADFKINLDFKSLLVPKPPSPESYLQKDINCLNGYTSPSSPFTLNRTI